MNGYLRCVVSRVTHKSRFICTYSRKDLNPQPAVNKTDALTVELLEQMGRSDASFRSSTMLYSRCVHASLSGFEPKRRESESLMLPLHHRELKETIEVEQHHEDTTSTTTSIVSSVHGGIRTPSLLVRSQMQYPLCYMDLVEPPRIELGSNRLIFLLSTCVANFLTIRVGSVTVFL